MERKKSLRIYEASSKVIPGGVNSPVRAFFDMGIPPLVVAKGKGDTIWDEDGNAFIDYCGSWGPLILGHAHPSVVKAAKAQISKGSSFGITTKIEKEIAAFIVKLIPSIEKIRFVSTGTEATMSALRLAKGFTGKNKIIKFIGNYHGHHDSLLVQAGSGVIRLNSQASSKGISAEMIKDTLLLPFNDVKAVKECFEVHKDIAAVIVEPIAGNMGVVAGSKEFLETLKRETEKQGALLIFDEVITGFRVGLKGAQDLYGITPDITCFGKIIGGGFPAAAFGAKKEIMDLLSPLGEVYQAGTLSGNPVAMQAGLATLKEIAKEGFYEKLQQKADKLFLPIEKALKETKRGCLQRQGSMFTIFWGVEAITTKEECKKLDEEMFKKFFLHLLDKGIYIPPCQYETSFVSIAHTDENLEKTKEAILEFIKAR